MAEVLPQKPKRVLSAYNFFFQDQRSKIISGEADDCSVEGDQAAQDGAGPRKVSFQSLGKLVGRRWRRLAPEDRIEFEIAGAADKERYKKEMTAYKEECKILKRKQAQTQQETTEKKLKLGQTTQTNYNPNQAPVPKVIPRSAEHRNETISCQIASSFTNSTEHPSVYSRDGFGNTGHYSRQFSYSSAQRNDNYDYWYGQTAAGNHHGGGRYSSGMPYHSAAPPPYSSHPARYHDPGYASHSEDIAHSYPNTEVARAAESHHGGWNYSTGMLHYSEASSLYSSHPTRYNSGYTVWQPEDIADPSYSNAPPEVPLYENHSPQQQAYWTTSSYPHSEQSRYMPTTWNHSDSNEITQSYYNLR